MGASFAVPVVNQLLNRNTTLSTIEELARRFKIQSGTTPPSWHVRFPRSSSLEAHVMPKRSSRPAERPIRQSGTAKTQQYHAEPQDASTLHHGFPEGILPDMDNLPRRQEALQTYIHTCMHAYIHTYIHTYTHTHIHTYTHACIYTHRHVHIVCRVLGVPPEGREPSLRARFARYARISQAHVGPPG